MKAADLIVVDRNLFEVAVETISEAEVDLTMLDGEIVYRR
jgi:predicted amidohydrolase YtcJ